MIFDISNIGEACPELKLLDVSDCNITVKSIEVCNNILYSIKKIHITNKYVIYPFSYRYLKRGCRAWKCCERMFIYYKFFYLFFYLLSSLCYH